MKMATRIAYALTATVAAVSIGGIAQAQMASSPADYVKMAGAGDQYEIQSSKLVMKSSADPHIKQFANMMITDHMKSTNMVKMAAMKDGMHPMPPMLDADGKAMIAQLMAAKGPARDTLYVQQQMTAHDKALALHQDYAANGTSQPLKDAASNIVPVVQQHKSMLGQISTGSGM